jgi:hypothetical protein
MSSGSQTATLFINYRREDTAPYAGRLYDRLSAHFGDEQVFIDIDQIEPGEDFVEAINRKVGACEIAIVLIGPNWLRVTDASGKRRLDDTEDFVRMEIAAALQREIRIIPVLVGDASMPRKQDLPEALAPLSRRNAIELSETRFHSDVDRLIEAIEKPRTLPEKKVERFTGAVAPATEDAFGSATIAERPVPPHVSPDRTALYRRAMVATGIALVIGCAAWAVSVRRSPNAGSRASDVTVADSVASTSNSESPSPSSSPASKDAPAETVQQGLVSKLAPAGVSEKSLNDFLPSKTSSEDEWFRDVQKRADDGSADAQFEMGTFYEFGFGSGSVDASKAVEWYRKAAGQGNVLAQEGLEDLSRTGSATSEFDALKLDTRRLSRQQKGTNGFLDEMNTKAMDAIKHIKP